MGKEKYNDRFNKSCSSCCEFRLWCPYGDLLANGGQKVIIMRRFSVEEIASRLELETDDVYDELVDIGLITNRKRIYSLTEKGKASGCFCNEDGQIMFPERVIETIGFNLKPNLCSWLCENCGDDLTDQNGFKIINDKYICKKCGYENSNKKYTVHYDFKNEKENRKFEAVVKRIIKKADDYYMGIAELFIYNGDIKTTINSAFMENDFKEGDIVNVDICLYSDEYEIYENDQDFKKIYPEIYPERTIGSIIPEQRLNKERKPEESAYCIVSGVIKSASEDDDCYYLDVRCQNTVFDIMLIKKTDI